MKLSIKNNPTIATTNFPIVGAVFFAVVYIFFDSMKIGNFVGDILGLVAGVGLAAGAVIIRSAKKPKEDPK